MRKAIIGIMACAAIACGDNDNPLGPSSNTGADDNGVHIASTVTSGVPDGGNAYSEPAPDLVDPRPTPLYNIVGPNGCLEGDSHEWTVTLNEHGYRMRTASFHDDEAGCGITDRKPGGRFNIITEVEPYEIGATTFQWSGGISCGRYQADVAVAQYNGDEEEEFTTIVGIVINTGVDCTTPTPPIVVPPPIPPIDPCVSPTSSQGLRSALSCHPIEPPIDPPSECISSVSDVYTLNGPDGEPISCRPTEPPNIDPVCPIFTLEDKVEYNSLTQAKGCRSSA